MIQARKHPYKKDHFLVERMIHTWEDYPKTKPDLSDYPKVNRDIAVIGGGPTAPDDYKQCIENGIDYFISANWHGLLLHDCDVVTFLDPPNERSQEKLKHFEGAKISKLVDHTDVYVVNEFPDDLSFINDTGMFSVWLAGQLTKGKVYMCGFTLRQGTEEHFHNEIPTPKVRWTMPYYRLAQYWNKVLDYVGRDRVIPLSGPLK